MWIRILCWFHASTDCGNKLLHDANHAEMKCYQNRLNVDILVSLPLYKLEMLYKSEYSTCIHKHF